MNQTTCNLSDRQQLTDLLCCEKHLALVYGIECCEIATPTLRETMVASLCDAHKSSAEIFEIMNAKGWYPVKKAEEQKLNAAKQQFGSMASV